MRAAGGSSSRGRGPSAAADVPPASGRERTGEPSRKKGAASAAPDPSAADGNAADGNVPPVDYHALYDVPECPVFHPTAKEFNHPGKYIESISEQVRPFGICKIVPPPSWKPPFMIDRKSFTVRTRVQQVNYLDGQARQRLIFVENLCRFWSKRGQELEKLPVIAQAPLDVCRLYHEVRLRGGMAAVVDKKLWSEVARAMDMESSHGSALRTQYTKILLPYEEWKVSIGEYRVQTDGQEEEEDEEEAAARREREKRLEEERERRRKRKEEKLSERMANEGEDGKPARLTRGRAKEEGGVEEEESSVTFSMAAGVIRVGSKVSVFWDGDGVSYKGVVRRTCERRGCLVFYDADGETHWEDPESIRLLGTGEGGSDAMEEDNDEGDLPMLDSLGGQGALASLDTCLEAGAELSAAVRSLVKTEPPDPLQGAARRGDAESGAGGSGEKKSSGGGGKQQAAAGRVAPPKAEEAGAGSAQQREQGATGGGAEGGSGRGKVAKEEAEDGAKADADVVLQESADGQSVAGEHSGSRMGGGRAGKMGGGHAWAGDPGGSAADGGEGDGDEDEDDEYRFGYHDGNTYSLQGFRKMANDWKETHFERTLKKISEEDVEAEYWRIICTPETPVNVEYGSELHTTQHGSGFPTHGNVLNPLDSKTTSSYCRSGWNLNNLNECTLLRFVKEDIPGILSPWLYMGMCFSSFCWHNEDHFLYSINYLWEGDPKQWYGVPGDEADLFETTLREYAPQLFELQPDVLFQLVTMIAPSVLLEKGVRVCRARQRAGEFMVTFPRAYHGGFNMGYNVAESCNFALTDWIPWGLMSDRWYRELGRAQVFSHPGLLVSLAQDSDTVETAMWLLSDLERYVALEQQGVQALVESGLRTRRQMETTAGILTNMLSANSENEAPNTMLDGKRLCAGRMKMSNMSMQDIRRQRESQGQDECCICLGSTFLFLVRCTCNDRRVSCVAHAHRMCSCPMVSKTLEERFSSEQLAHLVGAVRLLAERPAVWMGQVDDMLGATSRGDACPPVRTLQALATEAERFPRALSMVWQRQDQLKQVLKQAKAWSSQAQAVLQAAKKSEPKGRVATKDNLDSCVAIADIQKLIQDASELKAVPDDLEPLEGLLASVTAWRERCREVMQQHGQQGLRHLDDEALQRILADGHALHVQVPELRKVIHEADLRTWLAALPPIPGSCPMLRVQELVADADAKKLQGAQVDTVRRALELAEMARSRLQKARGRGTSVAVLTTLLQDIVKDKARQEAGLVVELEEEQQIRKTLEQCDEWTSRVTSALVEGCAGEGWESGAGMTDEGNRDPRPWLKELEQLQEEYQAIGVYIESCEALRRRIETAQAWRRKALRIAPAVLSPVRCTAPAGVQMEVEDAATRSDAAGPSTDAAGAGAAEPLEGEGGREGVEAGAAEEAGAAAAGAPQPGAGAERPAAAGAKRSVSKKDREREAKRQRKGEAATCGGSSNPGGGGAAVVGATRKQILELLQEEGKLHVRVEEAVTLRMRLEEKAEWCKGARALLAEGSATIKEFNELVSAGVARGGVDPKDERVQKAEKYSAVVSAALEKGDALGLELEEEGRTMREWLLGLEVGQLLAAGATPQREHLVHARAQADALNVASDSPMLAAINSAMQILEAQGCVCGASLHGDSRALSCLVCRKSFHPNCVGLSATDPRIASSAGTYLCAPCRREGAKVDSVSALRQNVEMAQSAAVWMQGEPLVGLKLPPGWIQTTDQMGSRVFVQQSSDGAIVKAEREPPAGSAQVIPCSRNPCLSRAPETAALCQVCFEVDDVPDEVLDCLAGGPATDEAAKLAKLAREAARERGELLQCLECGVCVHDGCYGGRLSRAAHPADGSSPAPFLCRPCEYGVRSAVCVLCGVVGGALSPATCGGWAHVSCALWAPVSSGVDFEKPSASPDALNRGEGAGTRASSQAAYHGVTESGGASTGTARKKGHRILVPSSFKMVQAVLGKDVKDSKRRSSGAGSAGTTCQFCPNAKAGGVLVKCQEKGCKLSAHPVCGFEHGWYLFLDTGIVQEAEEAPVEGNGDGDKKKGGRAKGGARVKKGAQRKDGKAEVERLVFCQQHAPHEEDDDDTLYCICQRRYQEGEWMIECEHCQDWFHGECVGVKESEADTIVNWRCPKCRAPPVLQEPAHVGAGKAGQGSGTPDPQAADLHLLLNLAGGRGA